LVIFAYQKRKKNAVSGNILASAAFFGQKEILKFVLGKCASKMDDPINQPCKES